MKNLNYTLPGNIILQANQNMKVLKAQNYKDQL